MRILIDGDACPRVKEIEEIAKKYSVDLILYCDIYHNINLDYGKVKVVDSGFQSVDMYIINECKKEDIIVTQDYGVASIVLNKGCFCVNPKGFMYNNENIDKLLFERHLKSKVRQSGGRLKGPKKRSEKDDIALKNSLIGLLDKN
ncbi:MAG: YaiI/YqxD family protein [Clostridium perfringens]|nr:YaiI/YqxD family protein [Clostridium perfringens]